VTDSDVRGSNPKYPTLVGTKIASQLSLMIRQMDRLAELEQRLMAIAENGRRHREKWGRARPETDRAWLEFWLDEGELFDDAQRLQDEIGLVRQRTRKLVMEALDVVNHNGMNVTGTGTVRELEQLLAIARGLAAEESMEEAE
jgi:hypothetical protein